MKRTNARRALSEGTPPRPVQPEHLKDKVSHRLTSVVGEVHNICYTANKIKKKLFLTNQKELVLSGNHLGNAIVVNGTMDEFTFTFTLSKHWLNN